MFTASSSRASSARAAVVERLRRVLFSPSRLLTAGTLACVLACGGFAAAQDSYIFTHSPTAEDANHMVQVEDGNEIPTYYKSYADDKIDWNVGETVTVEGLYYKAKTNGDGYLNLVKEDAISEADKQDQQKYQLVYVYKGKVENDPQAYNKDELDFSRLVTKSEYATFPDADKALFDAYYVEYDIDPATGLRKLYTETDVIAAGETVKGFTEYFDSMAHSQDSLALSTVEYKKKLVGASTTKVGGGQAVVGDGSPNSVVNITVNGGVLEFKGATTLTGTGDVTKDQTYGDAATLRFADNAVIDAGATLTNGEGGYVKFGGNAEINGAYISQYRDSKLLELPDLEENSTDFIGKTVVNGLLVVADAEFDDELILKAGSESYLYGETDFGAQSVVATTADGKVGLAHGVTVENGATLYAGARNLDNATVKIDEGGNVVFTNVNDVDKNENHAVDVVVKRDKNGKFVVDENGKFVVELVVNKNYEPWDGYDWVRTLDEDGTPTDLTVDNTYEKMVKTVRNTELTGGLKDDVNSSSFVGGGTITIRGELDPPSTIDGNQYVQTDFFTIFNGDKSGFTGDTNVERGALVLAGVSHRDTQEYAAKKEAYEAAANAYNQAQTQYENGEISQADLEAAQKAADDARLALLDALPQVKQEYGQKGSGTFAVHGVTLGDAKKMTNGRLALWRDTLNGELTPGDEENYKPSLETAPILSAGKLDFQGYVEVTQDADADGNPIMKETTKHKKESGLGAQIVFNTAFSFDNKELAQQDVKDLFEAGYVKDKTTEYEGYHPDLVTDIASARTLATLNADEIAFSESNYIWYDDVSRLKGSADMTLNLNAPTIKIYTDDTADRFGSSVALGEDTDDAGNVVGRYYNVNAGNTEALRKLFDKPLVNATITANAAETGTDGYQVKLNASQVADFAEKIGHEKFGSDYFSELFPDGLNDNAKKIAREIDGMRHTATNSEQEKYNRTFNEALYNEDNADKVAQTLYNLSLLGFTTPQLFVHYGNPVSPFFGGSAISAVSRRGQDEDERVVTNDNDQRRAEAESALAKEKEEDAGPTRGVWASYTYTNVAGDSYDDGGPMPGYDLERSGIIGGVRRQYDATLSGGLFFGLTTPEVGSTFSLGNSLIGDGRMSTKMEMTDFQFAGHLEKVFADNWELSLFVGGGMQKMDWERDLTFDNTYYRYKSTGDGNTLTGTAYLAYRWNVDKNWTLRPTIGLDSEHSWLYAFKEEGEAGELRNGYVHMKSLAQPYRFDQTYYNRNLARVGFTLAYDGDQGWAGLNGRMFYSTQLGGKPCPMISYSAVAGENVVSLATTEKMSTHVMGSDAFSVGGGGYMHLNKAKTLTANGDINSIWYKNATTLNVTGGVSYRY